MLSDTSKVSRAQGIPLLLLDLEHVSAMKSMLDCATINSMFLNNFNISTVTPSLLR